MVEQDNITNVQIQNNERIVDEPTDAVRFDQLAREKTRLESKLKEATNQHDQVLTVGVPILLLVLIIDFVFFARVYPTMVDPNKSFVYGLFVDFMAPERSRFITFIVHTVSLGLAIGGGAALFYYFRYRQPLNKIRQALQDYDEKLRQERISTPEGWRLYLKEELQRLTYVTDRAFLTNPERAAQAKKWGVKADRILVDEEEGHLIDAQSLISSISKLILTEEDELREQRNWRNFAVVIMFFYITGLAIASVFFDARIPPDQLQATFVFGVPLLVVIWGAIGSLAAILYRFYTEEGRIRFDVEVRWLIARPIIGIIMGAMAYLTLQAGLILLSTPSGEVSGRPEVYWIVAFLAGFSDKFYIGIINLLVYRTVGNKASSQNDDE